MKITRTWGSQPTRGTPKRHSVQREEIRSTVSLTAAVNEEDVQYRQRRNAIGLFVSYTPSQPGHLEYHLSAGWWEYKALDAPLE
jgi:hypothetical protein